MELQFNFEVLFSDAPFILPFFPFLNKTFEMFLLQLFPKNFSTHSNLDIILSRLLWYINLICNWTRVSNFSCITNAKSSTMQPCTEWHFAQYELKVQQMACHTVTFSLSLDCSRAFVESGMSYNWLKLQPRSPLWSEMCIFVQNYYFLCLLVIVISHISITSQERVKCWQINLHSFVFFQLTRAPNKLTHQICP